MKIFKKLIQLKKGFVILYALIVMSILLMLTISITNINVREYQLSQYGSESLSSYYAAESGLECALYWDLKEEKSAFRYDATEPTGRDIYCMGNTYRVGDDSADPVYTLNIDLSSSGIGANVEVVVDKTGGKTDIVSRGYNTSDLDSKYAVERGLKVGYGDATDEAGPVCEAFDIALVLDISGSIHESGLAKLKEASNGIVDNNETGEDKAKFTVVTFDYKATMIVLMDTDKDVIKNAINAIPYNNWTTNTEAGLLVAKEEFVSNRAREDAFDVAVLVTDGQPNNCTDESIYSHVSPYIAYNNEACSPTANIVTANMAQKLKDDGVHLIVIGVGSSVNDDYLQNTLASDPDSYYPVNNFNKLKQLTEDFDCSFFMRSIGELKREEF